MAATTATPAHSWKDPPRNDGSCGDGTATDPTRTEASASSIEVPFSGTEGHGVPRGDGISYSTNLPTDDNRRGGSTNVAPQVSSASAADFRGGTTTAEGASLSTLGPAVDSALRAALREPRERLALLRLESLLVDFCRTESAGWLEVSGLYNATWIGPPLTGRPQGGGGGALGGTSTTIVGPLPSAPNPALYGYGPSAAPMAHPPMGGVILPGPPSGPRPATSFQRCVLHRLADRFGIVRESGSVMEGSIRLIKVPDTKIPPRLLQDMDPSEYSIDAVTGALSQAHLGEPRFAPAAQQPGAATSVDASSQTMPPYPTFVGPAGASPSPHPRSSSSRNMKIMKRTDPRSRSSSTPSHASSAGTNTNSNSSTSSGGGGRPSLGSDLSERERAYAEARARIFRDHDDEGSTPAGGSSEDARRAGEMNDVGGVPSSAVDDVDDDPTAPVSTPALAFAAAAAAVSAASHRSPLKSSCPRPNDGASNSGNVQDGNASMTTENKATYRNRMEEAADPDFKRGVVVAVAQPVQYLSAVPTTNPLSHGVQAPAPPYSQRYQPHVVAPEYSGYAPALVTGYPYGPYAAVSNGATLPPSHFPSLHSSVKSRTTAGAGTPSAGRTSLDSSAREFVPSWASAAAASAAAGAGAASSTVAPSMATTGMGSEAAASRR